ncbi:MAG: DUF1573 domain-containing protein [Sedimentisphaerales bacterium]|nr:DUF1573 domain-containing protein [Sedimentisphaerales bacterium]
MTASHGGCGPRIVFEEAVHDFGNVDLRSRNACEFQFRNAGTEMLVLERVIDSTCGCTATKLAKTEYAPGEEGAIEVTYVASSVPMTAHKMLTVHTNDEAHREIRLTLKARVVARVLHEPERLDLVLGEQARARTPITLKSLDGVPFSVTGLLCSGNCITADIDPAVKATEFTIHAILDVEKLRNQPAGYLKLLLTHPHCRDIRIRFTTLPEFQFTPPSLVLFNLKPGAPRRMDVWLANNYGQDFDIASVVSEQNLIDVVGKQKVPPKDGQGTRYRLTLSILVPDAEDGRESFNDTLSVHLAGGQVQRLQCHGYYRIKDPDRAAGPYPLPGK